MENSYQTLLQFVLHQILEIGIVLNEHKKNVLISAASNRIYHSLIIGEESYGTLNERVPKRTKCSHGVD